MLAECALTVQELKSDPWLRDQAKQYADKIGKPELIDFSRYSEMSHIAMVDGNEGRQQDTFSQEIPSADPGQAASASTDSWYHDSRRGGDQEGEAAAAFIGLGPKAPKSSLQKVVSFLRKRLG